MRDWFLPAWPRPLSQAALFVVIVAVLGISLLIIGEALPRKIFHHDAPFFRAFAWERNGAIYDALKIKKWKDLLPDNSKILPWLFKKKLTRFHDPAYTLRLLQETCVAEVVHWALILLSPVFLYFMNPGYGAVMCVLYILGNLPYIMIQRYNRVRLAVLYTRQLQLRKEVHP